MVEPRLADDRTHRTFGRRVGVGLEDGLRVQVLAGWDPGMVTIKLQSEWPSLKENLNQVYCQFRRL